MVCHQTRFEKPVQIGAYLKPYVSILEIFAINPWMCFFPFQREWLSCVHSVYPFQDLIGTVAETFIQVQSSDTEFKKKKGGGKYLAEMFGSEFHAKARAADKPPTQRIQTKVGTSRPLCNYTL